MRRLAWFAAAALALAGAGAAIAWHGAFLKTDAVAGEFSATRTSIRERTCVGTDGHTYRHTNVVLAGTMTSADSRLSGRAVFRLRIREDVMAGLGTTEGRMWIGDSNFRKVSANVVAVKTGANLNGAMNGRVHRRSWLVANFSATWDGTTLHGYLGQDTFGPTNSAVIQSRLDVRCARPGHDDQQGEATASAGTGRLEVRKSLSPSDDPGRFDLRIDGKTEAAAAGNDGSTGEETVSAGRHEISEVAVGGAKLDDYTTTISCRDGNGAGVEIERGGADGNMDLVVANGADVVCTVTNTRKAQATAKLEVRKEVEPTPTTDPGRFNLFIKQGATVIDSESNEGDGGSTGKKTVNAGTYEVSETAADGTKLDDYTTSISCRDGNGSGSEIAKSSSDADLDVTVAAGADVVCVITNTRKS